MKQMKHAWHKFRFVGGVLTGAVIAMYALGALGNPLTANLSEDALDVRTNGVIRTQQQEIKRLRAELRQLKAQLVHSKESVTTVKVQDPNIVTCSSHNDCPAINMVCQSNVCQVLKDPICRCQTGNNGEYVLCVAQDGMQARTVDCGSNSCTDDPYPRCTTN